MDILKTPISQSVMDSLNDYIENNIAPLKFVDTNTATGVSDATLNKTSGDVLYTNVLSAARPFQFTLNNSLVTSTTRISWSINYTKIGNEALFPCYYNCSSGVINFWVAQTNGTSSNPSGFTISYQILNP
jgi:hypothetical protein